MNTPKKGMKKRLAAGFFPPLDFMQQGNKVAPPSYGLQNPSPDALEYYKNIIGVADNFSKGYDGKSRVLQKPVYDQNGFASGIAQVVADNDGVGSAFGSVDFAQVKSKTGLPDFTNTCVGSSCYVANAAGAKDDGAVENSEWVKRVSKDKSWIPVPSNEAQAGDRIVIWDKAEPGDGKSDYKQKNVSGIDKTLGVEGQIPVHMVTYGGKQVDGNRYIYHDGSEDKSYKKTVFNPAASDKGYVAYRYVGTNQTADRFAKSQNNPDMFTPNQLNPDIRTRSRPTEQELMKQFREQRAVPANAQTGLPQNQNGGMVDDGAIFVPHAMLRQYQQGGQTSLPPEMMQGMMPPEGMMAPMPQPQEMQQPPMPQQDPFADITMRRQPDSGDYAALLDYRLYNGQPNVEVEAGEFMQTPDGQTYRVTGDRHYEGGEEIAAPADSRVFSDHLKISKGVSEVLGFGSKRKKRRAMTYADAAKKLDTARLDKLMEEETDPILRGTSARMRDRNARKLDTLFQVQQVHNGEALKDRVLKDRAAQATPMQQAMPPEMMAQMPMPPEGAMPQQQMQGMPIARYGKRVLPMAEDGRRANIMSVPAIDYGASRQGQFPPAMPAGRMANRMELADAPLMDAPMDAPPMAAPPGAYQPKLPWMQLAPAAYQLAANASRRTTPLEQMNYNDTLSQLQNQRTGADFSAGREQNNRDYRSALRQIGFDEGMSAQLLGQKLTANQGLAAQEFNTANALQNQQSSQLAQFYQGRDEANQGLRDQYNVRNLQSQAVQQQNIGNAMQSAGNVMSGWQREKTAAAVAQQMNPNVRFVAGPDGQPVAVTAGTEMYFNTPAGQFTPLQYDRRRTRTKTDRYGRRTTEQTYDEE